MKKINPKLWSEMMQGWTRTMAKVVKEIQEKDRKNIPFKRSDLGNYAMTAVSFARLCIRNMDGFEKEAEKLDALDIKLTYKTQAEYDAEGRPEWDTVDQSFPR